MNFWFQGTGEAELYPLLLEQNVKRRAALPPGVFIYLSCFVCRHALHRPDGEGIPVHGEADVDPGEVQAVYPLRIVLVGGAGVAGEHAGEGGRLSAGTRSSSSGRKSTARVAPPLLPASRRWPPGGSRHRGCRA